MCVEGLRDVEEGRKVVHIVASAIFVARGLTVAVDIGAATTAKVESLQSPK